MPLTPEEEKELAKVEAALNEAKGETAPLEERFERLLAKQEWDGELGCPQCGSEELATIESIEGSASCTVRNGDIEWGGGTDVNWDSSTTIGVECSSCYWEYRDADWLNQLKPTYEIQ